MLLYSRSIYEFIKINEKEFSTYAKYIQMDEK